MLVVYFRATGGSLLFNSPRGSRRKKAAQAWPLVAIAAHKCAGYGNAHVVGSWFGPVGSLSEAYDKATENMWKPLEKFKRNLLLAP